MIPFKRFVILISMAMVTILSCSRKESSEAGTEIVQDTIKGSPAATAENKIGACGIFISYHSPAVRGRIVWGGLVPYDRVWVTGAHMATSIEFTSEVQIGQKTVAAGKYAFFTIPGKEDWTLILNTNWQQHLADDYDDKLDVVRVTLEPETLDEHFERLRYDIDQQGEHHGVVSVCWEKLRVSLPVRCR